MAVKRGFFSIFTKGGAREKQTPPGVEKSMLILKK
jgi:hypothetical protein